MIDVTCMRVCGGEVYGVSRGVGGCVCVTCGTWGVCGVCTHVVTCVLCVSMWGEEAVGITRIQTPLLVLWEHKGPGDR